MTSHVPKSSSDSKKLGDLLQEQEEPFSLDHHHHLLLLQETDLMFETEKNMGVAFGCNFLKRSACRCLKRSKKFIPICAKVVKKVVHKFLAFNFKPKLVNIVFDSANGGEEEARKIGESIRIVAESDRFSSASSTTLFYSCYGSDAEDVSTSIHNHRHDLATIVTGHTLKESNLLKDKEIAAEYRKVQWRCLEENKQLSPVSVLDEIHSEEGSPLLFHYKDQAPSTSTSKDLTKEKKFENDLHTLPLKKQSCTYSSHCQKSKRVLQETDQLLLDCVREVLDSHGRNGQVSEIPGPEELGKLIWEKVGRWSRSPGDETNTIQLLPLELSHSVRKWTDFREETRELGTRIGDFIMGDVIDEIVADMIEFR